MNRLTFVLERPCDTEPYTVTCPELPGLLSQGDTVHEALEMAKDAYDCLLGLGPYADDEAKDMYVFPPDLISWLKSKLGN